MSRRIRPLTDREARQIERDHACGEAVPAKGFCHECEKFVDEIAGKLHRATCKGVTPERRMAS